MLRARILFGTNIDLIAAVAIRVKTQIAFAFVFARTGADARGVFIARPSAARIDLFAKFAVAAIALFASAFV